VHEFDEHSFHQKREYVDRAYSTLKEYLPLKRWLISHLNKLVVLTALKHLLTTVSFQEDSKSAMSSKNKLQ
jgi:hypothetical protein